MKSMKKFAVAALALAVLAGCADDPADIVIEDEPVAFTFTPPANPPAAITSVSVAGSMNNWDPAATPMTLSDGVWSVELELDPGEYQYKYVFNGDMWPQDMCNSADWGNANGLIDPNADSCVDDGFGGQNAVRNVQ